MKLGRHLWRKGSVELDDVDWGNLPDRLGVSPQRHAEQREVFAALRKAVNHDLTEHQRRVFIAIALNETPMDALALELDSSRNAIYKTLFDARRKLRASLEAAGHSLSISGGAMNDPLDFDQVLAADSADPGCDAVLEILGQYAELDLAGEDPARRFPGSAAHLRSCPACREDYAGLLVAASESGDDASR